MEKVFPPPAGILTGFVIFDHTVAYTSMHVEQPFSFQTNFMTGHNLFELYKTYPETWDEMCHEQNIRSQYGQVYNDFSKYPLETLQQKDKLAGELFMNQGITFTVYSDNAGIERIFIKYGIS